MSGGHFAGILTPLTCRGSKGRSPLASLGTAQRLAPVHSGLPLCETCLSSPPTDSTPARQYFPPYIIKSKWRWRWVCGAGADCGRKRKAPPFIDFPFLKQAGHAPLRCEVSDNHVPYPAPYIFSLPVCTPLSSANTFLPYFPVISVFLFLNCFLFLLKGIKIAVMNISPTHNVWNAITAIVFFCYSVFVKLFFTVSPFSCYCYFILSQISSRSCNKFSSFISLRCWYQINPGNPTARKNETHKIFIACPLLLIPPYPNPHTRFTNKT